MSGSDESSDALWGRSFTSTAVTEGGQPRTLVRGTVIQVSFEKRGDQGGARWHAGCNAFGADVIVTDAAIQVGPIHGTQRGCGPARRDQDDWLNAFFSSNPSWTLHADVLTLATADTVITLTG